MTPSLPGPEPGSMPTRILSSGLRSLTSKETNKSEPSTAKYFPSPSSGAEPAWTRRPCLAWIILLNKGNLSVIFQESCTNSSESFRKISISKPIKPFKSICLESSTSILTSNLVPGAKLDNSDLFNRL